MASSSPQGNAHSGPLFSRLRVLTVLRSIRDLMMSPTLLSCSQKWFGRCGKPLIQPSQISKEKPNLHLGSLSASPQGRGVTKHRGLHAHTQNSLITTSAGNTLQKTNLLMRCQHSQSPEAHRAGQGGGQSPDYALSSMSASEDQLPPYLPPSVAS